MFASALPPHSLTISISVDFLIAFDSCDVDVRNLLAFYIIPQHILVGYFMFSQRFICYRMDYLIQYGEMVFCCRSGKRCEKARSEYIGSLADDLTVK